MPNVENRTETWYDGEEKAHALPYMSIHACTDTGEFVALSNKTLAVIIGTTGITVASFVGPTLRKMPPQKVNVGGGVEYTFMAMRFDGDDVMQRGAMTRKVWPGCKYLRC